jgi:hypothetical protein
MANYKSRRDRQRTQSQHHALFLNVMYVVITSPSLVSGDWLVLAEGCPLASTRQ